MSRMTRDELESRLRQMSRREACGPSRELMERTVLAARQAAARRNVPSAALARRQWALRVLAVCTGLLPIPMLFLWLDWAALSSLLHSVMPGRLSAICAGVYVWMNASILALIYMFLCLALVRLALRIRVPEELAEA